MKQEAALLYQLRNITKDCMNVAEYAYEMRMLNQSYIQGAMQAVCHEEQEELGEILKNYRKLRKTIGSLERTDRESFDYECGIFAGTYKIFVEIEELCEKRRVQRDFEELLQRKHVTDVINYLYKNMNAKQGDIAENVQVSPSHLSDILNRLMEAGYVERYGRSKGTRYNLTKAGRETCRQLKKKKKTVEVCIEAGFRIVSDKERFLKEISVENEKGILKKEDKYAKWKKNFGNYTEHSSTGQ